MTQLRKIGEGVALHENLGKVMKLRQSNPDPVFQMKSLVVHLRQGVDNTTDKKKIILYPSDQPKTANHDTHRY